MGLVCSQMMNVAHFFCNFIIWLESWIRISWINAGGINYDQLINGAVINYDPLFNAAGISYDQLINAAGISYDQLINAAGINKLWSAV
jgi:hypothetical protein